MDVPRTKNHILLGMTCGLEWENIVTQQIRSIVLTLRIMVSRGGQNDNNTRKT